MYVAFIMLLILSAGMGTAYSQEPGLATYQETAQVLVDKTISGDIKSSVTLQSTSVQEIKIPAELERAIREDGRVSAVILTNEEQCILGVAGESCIMINIKRDPSDTNFPAIQDTAKAVSGMYIDRINEAFGADAEFHSVFVHSMDDTNAILGTSGVVSGGGAISAVYTMPMESTDSMYEKISAILLPREIRDSGGFYDVAKNMSRHEDAKMTFSMIPLENNSLLQLKMSVDYSGIAPGITELGPLEYLQTGSLQRSGYFSAGFYPLNSLLQVVVLSSDIAAAHDIRGDVLETRDVGGEQVPTDVTRQGWVFDPPQGEKIQGIWIFGTSTSVDADTVTFSLGAPGAPAPDAEPFPESVLVGIIIAAAASAAVIFYLRGIRSR